MKSQTQLEEKLVELYNQYKELSLVERRSRKSEYISRQMEILEWVLGKDVRDALKNIEKRKVYRRVYPLDPDKVTYPLTISPRYAISGWYVLIDNQWIGQNNTVLKDTKMFDTKEGAIRYMTIKDETIISIPDKKRYLEFMLWFEPRQEKT